MGEETPLSGEILIYQTEDRQTRVEVRMLHETVWLSQTQMAELFQKDARIGQDSTRNPVTTVPESHRTAQRAGVCGGCCFRRPGCRRMEGPK